MELIFLPSRLSGAAFQMCVQARVDSTQVLYSCGGVLARYPGLVCFSFCLPGSGQGLGKRLVEDRTRRADPK